MKVLVIEPVKQPVVKEIGNTLKDMQRMVGGYIQAYYPWMDEVAIICNDEGKIMGLPLNRPLFIKKITTYGQKSRKKASSQKMCSLKTLKTLF